MAQVRDVLPLQLVQVVVGLERVVVGLERVVDEVAREQPVEALVVLVCMVRELVLEQLELVLAWVVELVDGPKLQIHLLHHRISVF